ncbi:hypothetical protein EL75_4824 [Escherichia coli]|nr:hypothetical protein EL75_4824 [Escherichia coli]KGM76199.1 hypothetical protein EL80_5143 [Escherichia coli]
MFCLLFLQNKFSYLLEIYKVFIVIRREYPYEN